MNDDVAVVLLLELATSSTSHWSTVVLFQGVLRVEETTYLGMVLNLSANSPLSAARRGRSRRR